MEKGREKSEKVKILIRKNEDFLVTRTGIEPMLQP